MPYTPVIKMSKTWTRDNVSIHGTVTHMTTNESMYYIDFIMGPEPRPIPDGHWPFGIPFDRKDTALKACEKWGPQILDAIEQGWTLRSDSSFYLRRTWSEYDGDYVRSLVSPSRKTRGMRWRAWTKGGFDEHDGGFTETKTLPEAVTYSESWGEGLHQALTEILKNWRH